MTVEIYNILKSGLVALVDGNNAPVFKTVKMFFNEIEDEMMPDNKIDAYLKPACLIQFTDIECADLQGRAQTQQCSYKVILHMVWDIRIKDDLAILIAKQLAYAFMQNITIDTTVVSNGRFLRRAEIINPEYKTLINIQQIYQSILKDFSAVPTTNTGPVTTLTINPSIVLNT